MCWFFFNDLLLITESSERLVFNLRSMRIILLVETILSILQIEPSALRPVFHSCASLYFADRILGKISRGFFHWGCYLLLPLFLLPIGCVGYRTRIYHVHSEIQCLSANKLYQHARTTVGERETRCSVYRSCQAKRICFTFTCPPILEMVGPKTVRVAENYVSIVNRRRPFPSRQLCY